MAVEQSYPDIREAVARLCARFPGEYWRKLDSGSEYPTEFVRALTEAGYLSVLIPEQYGGSGLPLSAACAVLEAVSYTHLTLPTTLNSCSSRWSPCH